MLLCGQDGCMVQSGCPMNLPLSIAVFGKARSMECLILDFVAFVCGRQLYLNEAPDELVSS